METTNRIFVCDLDNTCYANYAGWDEACALTAESFGIKRFVFSRRPDGTKDADFTKRSINETLALRLSQLGLEKDHVDTDQFWEIFASQAALLTPNIRATKYEGVEIFLERINALCRGHQPIILSGGPKTLQLRALQQTRLLGYFHQRLSFFRGSCQTKQEGLRRIVRYVQPNTLIHIGDTVEDIQITHEETLLVPQKIAVGVTVSGWTAPDVLRNAGANFIIERFDMETIDAFCEYIRSL